MILKIKFKTKKLRLKKMLNPKKIK